jgi:DNA-binding transcriptional LysR family regulator
VGTTRIATVHRRLAQFYAQQLPLKILKPPVEIPSVVESMQWHAIRDGDPGLKWLRRILHSACAEHLRS